MGFEQALAPPAEDVITGLKFLVDLPMLPLVGQQEEKKIEGDMRFSKTVYFLKNQTKKGEKSVLV